MPFHDRSEEVVARAPGVISAAASPQRFAQCSSQPQAAVVDHMCGPSPPPLIEDELRSEKDPSHVEMVFRAREEVLHGLAQGLLLAHALGEEIGHLAKGLFHASRDLTDDGSSVHTATLNANTKTDFPTLSRLR